MKKMLYMCAIEWKWIAQRPHFLEMELEKYYEVTVLSPVHVLKKIKSQKNTKLPARFKEFSLLPYQEKVRPVAKLSKSLFRSKVKNMNEYDIVWLGSALFEKYIPEDYTGTVVFDFMDDCISMQEDPRMKLAYQRAQERLYERANLICVSSNYLMNLLPEDVRKKAVLVRNAFRGEVRIPPETGDVNAAFENSAESESAENAENNGNTGNAADSKKVRIGYVGTIAAWMDFGLLKNSLDRFEKAEYHFWGPVDGEVVEREGFVYHGVVDHSEIPKTVAGMDALMMPFLVNDIVKAVDPVKLYEYISYGKNIICVNYEEVERFEPYVWLYRDEKEFDDLLERLCRGELKCKYDADMQKEFLEENTWARRAKVVYEALESLD